MISATDVPEMPRGVRCHYDRVREIDVLLGPERVVMLDRIGLSILGQVDGQTTVGGISEALAQSHDTSRDVVFPDVVAFLADLAEKGFIRVAPA